VLLEVLCVPPTTVEVEDDWEWGAARRLGWEMSNIGALSTIVVDGSLVIAGRRRAGFFLVEYRAGCEGE
jgi:hypothetical protein